MRKIVFVSMWVVILMVGCVDRHASDRRVAQEKFNQALGLIRQANQGFVPQGQEVESQLEVDGQTVTARQADLHTYRQSMFAQAASALEEILDMGSVSQRVSTRRVLAEVYAAQVRYAAGQAMAQWAVLADQEATLMSSLGSVSRAESRLQLLNTDQETLLTHLRKDQSDTQKQIDQATQESAELSEQMASLSRQIDALNAEIKQGQALARQLQGQAIVATQSQRQYDLYEQSAAAQRQAQIASTQVQQLAVSLDIVQSKHAMLEKQAGFGQQVSKTLGEQVADAVHRQANRPLDEARAAKSDVQEQLMTRFNQIAKAYDESVHTVLDRAVEKINESIDLLSVITEAQGADKSLVQLEKLSHMVDKTHLLTEHILAASSHGHVLEVISHHGRRVMPDRVSVFAQRSSQLHEQQRKLIETAKQNISDAAVICEEISNGLGEEPTASIAKQQLQRLESYRQRIDQLRLTDPQG